jgi:hypothetical protein
MSATIQTTAELTCMSCWCGTPVGMANGFYRECRENGGTFHCPHGHKNVFRESDVKRLERELAAEKARRDQAESRARDANKRADTERTTRKRYQTRARNLEAKAVAGECPCCIAVFPDLAAHLAEKHPDFKPEEKAEAEE